MLINRYTLNLINQIKFEESNYVLDNNVKKIIQNIADQVGDPEYNRAPAFKKKKHIKNENFKVTQRIEKTGIDALFNKIRINLNKITSSSKKTNESFKEDIAKYIIEIKNESPNDWSENNKKINKFIIDIICTNHYYSDILVNIFLMLVNDFELSDLLRDEIETRNGYYNELEWFDPNDEYDKFCENNKKNEFNRGYTLFLVNVMKCGVVSIEYIVDMLNKLLGCLNEFILLDGYKGIVEEISELFFIVIKNGMTEIKKNTGWVSLYHDLGKISQYKANDYKSLSNKTVFKFMDINEFILKKGDK